MRQTVSPLMYAWAWADRDAGITGPGEAGVAPLQGRRREEKGAPRDTCRRHLAPVLFYHALTFSDRCKSIPPSRLLPERSTG